MSNVFSSSLNLINYVALLTPDPGTTHNKLHRGFSRTQRLLCPPCFCLPSSGAAGQGDDISAEERLIQTDEASAAHQRELILVSRVTTLCQSPPRMLLEGVLLQAVCAPVQLLLVSRREMGALP